MPAVLQAARRRRCSCSRCRTTRATCARRSPRARAATSSRRRRTRRSSSAIREVARGGRYVHPALGAQLIAADAEERRRAEEDPLSEREREVLRLLALGHTNQEIAEAALHLRPHRGDAPGAHHAEAQAVEPRRPRPLRARRRAARRRVATGSGAPLPGGCATLEVRAGTSARIATT